MPDKTDPDYIKHLQDRARASRGEAEKIEAEIDRLQGGCRHEWGEAKYDPIITKGYHVPGCVPRREDGYIPYDFVGYENGYDVPDKVEKKWSRTCKKCRVYRQG